MRRFERYRVAERALHEAAVAFSVSQWPSHKAAADLEEAAREYAAASESITKAEA
jgi:hypothetical protein